MELEKFSVRELTTQEQLMVNGGGKLGEFFAAVWEGIKDVGEWIWENISIKAVIQIGPNSKIEVGPK